MKKIVALLLAALMFASCTQTPSPADSTTESSAAPTSSVDEEYPLTVRDTTLYKKPEKIVSLSPSLTSVLGYYGEENRLVARSTYCLYSTQISALPDVGTAAQPDLEAIIKLQPDLVLTSQELSADTMEWLDKNGIAVLCLEPAQTLEETAQAFDDLLTVLDGKTAGKRNGEAAKEAFLASFEKLKAKTAAYRKANDLEPIAVLYVQELNTYVACAGTLENEILEMLGFTNAADEQTGRYVSEKMLKALNPHAMVFSETVTAEKLKKNAVYKSKTAVRKGNLAFVDMTAVDRRSPEMAQTFEKMLEQLYDGFADFSAEEETSEAASGTKKGE